MGTAIHRGTTMAHKLIKKAEGYGMEGIEVDGLDVVNCYVAMKDLVDRCRAASRPAFVDMRTYRFKGHSMSDPRKYRTREEEEAYEGQDPIGRLEGFLKERKLLTPAEIAAIYDEVKVEVREAVAWADASPHPTADELYHDVYVERWGPYTGTSLPLMLRENQ
jgi:pyruvate dehydrogenase E1 component alpha subunit